jgi:predicted amidophosphoribosyltransferase
LIWALTRRGNSSVLVSAPSSATTSTAPTCSHCGAALQVAWSHCPQCGVQV